MFHTAGDMAGNYLGIVCSERVYEAISTSIDDRKKVFVSNNDADALEQVRFAIIESSIINFIAKHKNVSQSERSLVN